MKIDTYIRTFSSVRLDRTEEWIEYSSDNAWPFYVSVVSWSGGKNVTLRGPGQKLDGERAVINRERRSYLFADLTPEVQRSLIGSRRDAIQVLIVEEDLR